MVSVVGASLTRRLFLGLRHRLHLAFLIISQLRQSRVDGGICAGAELLEADAQISTAQPIVMLELSELNCIDATNNAAAKVVA